MGNIENPVLEDFIHLWDNPEEYAQISIDASKPRVCQFSVIVETPSSPILEIPIPTIPGGNT